MPIFAHFVGHVLSIVGGTRGQRQANISHADGEGEQKLTTLAFYGGEETNLVSDKVYFFHVTAILLPSSDPKLQLIFAVEMTTAPANQKWGTGHRQPHGSEVLGTVRYPVLGNVLPGNTGPGPNQSTTQWTTGDDCAGNFEWSFAVHARARDPAY
ncbi:MAG: hypothetical protein M1837_002735 [Sclerophora amabilis]|nr:MAG: hypothetical protein M1837_002735 [Sclerophora amabilis]